MKRHILLFIIVCGILALCVAATQIAADALALVEVGAR